VKEENRMTQPEPGIPPVVGIIGGSGLYDIPGLDKGTWRRVESPFGEASDELLFGVVGGQRVVFLPRHGRGHKIPPTRLNFRANIDALKRAGVTEIISVSAVGSLKEELAPGTFVLIDQFIDRTFARQKSFFDTGLVAHVSMAEPVCGRLGDALMASAAQTGVEMVRGGTYLVMEGPQFSSKAESALYRQWGCEVIGMTNMPEAKLAREAEMCRHGHRLRLLASGPRPCHRRSGDRDPAFQCGKGKRPRRRDGSAAHRSLGAMWCRLSSRARLRLDYGAGCA
jgi:5'-methylthioadenosine phosphorylase